MTQFLETREALTSDELTLVKEFAELLILRRTATAIDSSSTSGSNRMNVDALMGMCRNMGGNVSSKQLIREAWDGVVEKLDRPE